MTKALVLINTKMGEEKEVLKKVKEIGGVKKAYIYYGVYDIIAEVETDDNQKLGKLVTDCIRRIPNVEATITLLIVGNQ
ncbi:MAG: Lrp/AsnC ligand binding domain-containing protein [Patescibacteria group bacterium]|nr:Lrp/AsnC ligand binding domain-containing protein [Patescibacteria group bacterium]MBU1876768.1 Lrp/AsnC ligand binding domain-containing protein [Patescibacteria group bacterium]